MPYIGHSPEVAQRRYESIDDISGSFNGSTTSFALQVGGVTPAPFPVASENVLISVGGVIQEPDGGGTNGFQLTGTNIVFSSAPASGQSFFGVILAGADYVTAGHAFPDGDAGNPSITFSQDLDSGLFRSGAGTTSVSANNNKIADFGPTEIVFNEDGDNVDFRVEGDTKANLFVVDAGNDKITLDGDLEPTTIHGNNFPTAGALSNRNLIINGAMQVAQRGTTSSSALDYCSLDRFRVDAAQGAWEFSQENLTSGDPYNLGFRHFARLKNTTVTTANSRRRKFQQYIEAQNVAQSGWNYVSTSSFITASFWVRSSVAGTYYFYLQTPNNSPDKSFTFAETLAADTWTKVEKTFPGDSSLVINNDNTTGLRISFNADHGTDFTGSVTLDQWETFSNTARTPDTTTGWSNTLNATFDVTGVQIEVGEKATPFEHRSYGDELQRCLRYYWTQNNKDGGAYGAFTLLAAYATGTDTRGMVNFPVPMRTLPSIDHSAISTFAHLGGPAPSDILLADGGSNVFNTGIRVTLSSNQTANFASVLRGNNSNNAEIMWDAEL